MKNAVTHIGIFFLKLIGYLPFWALYILSDLFYYIFKSVGYRKKTVYTNIRNAFPEKSDDEINEILKKFYRHLSDLFFETFKIQSLSKKDINKRISIKGADIVNKFYDEGKDVIMVLGHYGNWEWVPIINLFIKAQGTQVYHPLKSKPYDDYMLKLRGKWGNLNFPMKTCFRDMIRLKQENKRFVIGMIADQSPSRNKIQYYTSFFNQEVPVLLGIEKMAVKTNSPVVFMRVDKPKRGYYNLSIELLAENPLDYKEFEITDMHTKYLEDIIREKPEYWLWSHKRWKFKK